MTLTDEDTMTFAKHADVNVRTDKTLAVFHRSLLWVVAAAVTGTVIGFVIASRNDGMAMMQHTIFPFLRAQHLIQAEPSDRLTIGLWAILGAGLMITVPVIAYRTWRFDWPAIRRL